MSSVDEAKRVLKIEARSILDLIDRLDENFEKAVHLIHQCSGKVIVAGMGKSGHIGRKIASTLSSTGTSALFLHPAESSHGDLGVISEGDCLIVISYGGESEELEDLINYANRKGFPMIAITGDQNSQLAKASNLSLDIGVKEEACPLKLAPTSSSTAALVMGDALAMAVLKKKGFKEEDFAQFHPGGKIGRRLLVRIKDLMHKNGKLPVIKKEDSMTHALSVMTDGEVRGVAGVIDEKGELIGVLTDGDLRRHLEKNKNPLQSRMEDIMSCQPKTIDQNELAVKALFLMEQFSIQSLFVLDVDSRKPVGLIHLQDLIKAKIR